MHARNTINGRYGSRGVRPGTTRGQCRRCATVAQYCKNHLIKTLQEEKKGQAVLWGCSTDAAFTSDRHDQLYPPTATGAAPLPPTKRAKNNGHHPQTYTYLVLLISVVSISLVTFSPASSPDVASGNALFARRPPSP